MSIEVVSQTSLQQAETAQAGSPSEVKAEESKSVSAEVQDETADESEASEEQDSQDHSEESDDDASSDEEAEEKEERPKRKRGIQKRIGKLQSRLSEKDREIEYWREQALKNKPAEEKQQQAEPVKAKADGRPQSEDFDSHEDFVDALAEWKVEQKLKERETRDRETQVKAEFEKQIQAHNDRVEAFAKQHDDFFDVLDDVNSIQASITIQDAILSSDNGPALMYELAKNPEEFERINKLPAVAAARELGKIEARIANQSKQQTKEIKKTNAPRPISPVGSKAAAATKSLAEMDYDEYRRVREEQIKNSRRR